MTRTRPLLAAGVAAIGAVMVAPLVLDDDAALIVAAVATALFLAVYVVLRTRGRGQS